MKAIHNTVILQNDVEQLFVISAKVQFESNYMRPEFLFEDIRGLFCVQAYRFLVFGILQRPEGRFSRRRERRATWNIPRFFLLQYDAILLKYPDFCPDMLSRLLKQLLILPIRAYQLLLSPLLGPNKCRYQPTCSHYAIEAIQEWGIFKGTYLAVKRILRCHPWSNHPMHDPIPKRDEQA